MSSYLTALEEKGIDSESKLEATSDELLKSNDVDMTKKLIKALKGVIKSG